MPISRLEAHDKLVDKWSPSIWKLVLWSHQLLNCRRHFDMKWSSWFTLFFIFFLAAVFSSLFSQTSSDLSPLWISSRLGNRQLLSSSYITSQNRWWDYPTAWWNHQTPWKNYQITSLSCTTLRRKLVKSGFRNHKFLSEVAYSQDRRWFRQQDARHTENKAGRDGLSVGTISHFLAGRYPSSRFWIFNLEPHNICFSTTQILYEVTRAIWIWILGMIRKNSCSRIWKLYNPCHISMYRRYRTIFLKSLTQDLVF